MKDKKYIDNKERARRAEQKNCLYEKRKCRIKKDSKKARKSNK